MTNPNPNAKKKIPLAKPYWLKTYEVTTSATREIYPGIGTFAVGVGDTGEVLFGIVAENKEVIFECPYSQLVQCKVMGMIQKMPPGIQGLVDNVVQISHEPDHEQQFE